MVHQHLPAILVISFYLVIVSSLLIAIEAKNPELVDGLPTIHRYHDVNTLCTKGQRIIWGLHDEILSQNSCRIIDGTKSKISQSCSSTGPKFAHSAAFVVGRHPLLPPLQKKESFISLSNSFSRAGAKVKVAPSYIPRTRLQYSAGTSNNEKDRVEHNDEAQDSEQANDPSLERKSKSEWIDGKQMQQIMQQQKLEEQRRKEMEAFNDMLLRQKSFPTNTAKQQINFSGTPSESKLDKLKFSSKITYSDADTLQIEIPPPGVDSNAFFSGAFTAIWFSAILPATIGSASAGLAPLLFLTPFWLAGGLIGKTAFVDPFISSSLTIGEYLWTLEKRYFQRLGRLTRKSEEGPTELLRGCSVEVPIVVNGVPKYELVLYAGDKKIGIGRGLELEELEYIAGLVNEHCSKFEQSDSEI